MGVQSPLWHCSFIPQLGTGWGGGQAGWYPALSDLDSPSIWERLRVDMGLGLAA